VTRGRDRADHHARSGAREISAALADRQPTALRGSPTRQPYQLRYRHAPPACSVRATPDRAHAPRWFWRFDCGPHSRTGARLDSNWQAGRRAARRDRTRYRDWSSGPCWRDALSHTDRRSCGHSNDPRNRLPSARSVESRSQALHTRGPHTTRFKRRRSRVISRYAWVRTITTDAARGLAGTGRANAALRPSIRIEDLVDTAPLLERSFSPPRRTG